MSTSASPSNTVPLRRRSHAERTDLSDRRMLDAAVRLIIERGTEKTTLKDVGELAGYSRGLAGYRFGSKAGLFTFVVRSVAEDWLQEMKQVTQGKSGLAAINAATDAHLRFCQDAPDQVRVFYILWYESIGPKSELKQVIGGIHRHRFRDVVAWIEQGIADGNLPKQVDTEAAARQFCASIIGIVYQWLADPEQHQEVAALHQDLKRTMALLLAPD